MTIQRWSTWASWFPRARAQAAPGGRSSRAVLEQACVGLPASEDALKTAEDQLRRPLPAALRGRLLRNNGGDILVTWDGEDEEWQLHPVLDASDRETLRRSSNHLVREQETAREWPGFPPQAISIASQDGDQLVLLPDDDEPKLWLHETGDLEAVQIAWGPIGRRIPKTDLGERSGVSP